MTSRVKNDYVLELKTDKSLGTEDFARALLASWRDQMPTAVRPEYFDLGEPVRRSFDKEGLERAVRMWVDNQMPLYLSRRTRPRMMVSTKWRAEKGLDTLPFPWGATVWLDRSAGDALAIKLFCFLIDHLEPAFGSISTEEDSRAKHWITWEDRLGRAEKFAGLDVTDVLSGVYWITYFGPGSMKILGQESLRSLRAHRVESHRGGYLVWAYASISDAGTTAARKAEAEVIEQLGRQHFFDKAQVDIEALKVDEVTATRVERQIQEIRAARKS